MNLESMFGALNRRKKEAALGVAAVAGAAALGHEDLKKNDPVTNENAHPTMYGEIPENVQMAGMTPDSAPAPLTIERPAGVTETPDALLADSPEVTEAMIQGEADLPDELLVK